MYVSEGESEDDYHSNISDARVMSLISHWHNSQKKTKVTKTGQKVKTEVKSHRKCMDKK